MDSSGALIKPWNVCAVLPARPPNPRWPQHSRNHKLRRRLRAGCEVRKRFRVIDAAILPASSETSRNAPDSSKRATHRSAGRALMVADCPVAGRGRQQLARVNFTVDPLVLWARGDQSWFSELHRGGTGVRQQCFHGLPGELSSMAPMMYA